jgi:hypothetical protein
MSLCVEKVDLFCILCVTFSSACWQSSLIFFMIYNFFLGWITVYVTACGGSRFILFFVVLSHLLAGVRIYGFLECNLTFHG